jgi:hypothetical protein
MSKHILSYDKFLKENVSTPLGEKTFVNEAVKALTAEGFVITVRSTSRQLKNDNLFCTISYPKVVDFIREYYDFDFNTQVEYTKGNNLKQDAENLNFEDITIYSRGSMMRAKKANPEFLFSGIEDMVLKMKIFFAKAFVYTAPARGQFLFPKRNKKILWNAENSSESSLTKSFQSQHSRNLPDGTKRLLDSITPGFTKSYDSLISLDESNTKLITLMLCTLASLNIENPDLLSIKKIDPRTFSYNDSDSSKKAWQPLRNSIEFYQFTYSITKNILTKKDVFRTVSGVIVPDIWSIERSAWLQDYLDTYLKLQAMSQQKLDAYFEDFVHKRRGVIHAKKFNL